jgi:succinate dehydrogenase / fumarate reductase membrane anchor subunit
MSTMRTPLGRVRGHGSAKSGTGHFIAQRVTSIALLVLAIWFALAAALSIDSYNDAIAFVRAPWNAVGLILLIATGVYHMMLGMQEVIEDYIARPGTRAALLLANAFLCAALAIAGTWAVLQINFGW